MLCYYLENYDVAHEDYKLPDSGESSGELDETMEQQNNTTQQEMQIDH